MPSEIEATILLFIKSAPSLRGPAPPCQSGNAPCTASCQGSNNRNSPAEFNLRLTDLIVVRGHSSYAEVYAILVYEIFWVKAGVCTSIAPKMKLWIDHINGSKKE